MTNHDTPTAPITSGEALKLDACPFCGGAAHVETEFRHNRVIECGSCGASVGAAHLARGVEMWNQRAAEQVQVPSGEIPPFPEMARLPDIEHAQNTPADWDQDYRDTWQMLQVETRNKMQWRGYAIKLRNLLAQRAGAADKPVAWTTRGPDGRLESYLCDKEGYEARGYKLMDGHVFVPLYAAPVAASADKAAVCEGCNGHGLVGNILDTDTCPFCKGSGAASADAAPAGAVQIIQDLIDSHKRDVGGECDADCDIVLGMEAARDAVAASADAAPAGAVAWKKGPPTEQGAYWNWDGDNGHAPMIFHVLWSGTAKKCFVAAGQLGMREAVMCDEFGGWWLAIDEPNLPGVAAEVTPAPKASSAPDGFVPVLARCKPKRKGGKPTYAGAVDEDQLREHLARVFESMPASERLRGSEIAGQIRAAQTSKGRK